MGGGVSGRKHTRQTQGGASPVMPRTAFALSRAPGAEQEQKEPLGSCWGQGRWPQG